MNDSSRRFARFRAFTVGALALLLALPVVAHAQDEAIVRLLPASGQTGEIEARVGEPVELLVVKSRADAPATGEPLFWALEEGAEGTLDMVDRLSREGADGVEAGSARVHFTATAPGVHGIRVQSPVDPGCVDATCRMVAHRFTVRATAPQAVADGDGDHSGLVMGAAAAAAAIAVAAIADSGGDDGAPGNRLVAVAGNGQSALTNNPLPQALSVQAMSGGLPAANVQILWSATGGAVLSSSSTITSAAGTTSVEVLSVGPGPGPITITATRGDDPAVSATFTAGVDIAGLTQVSGDGQTTRVETTTTAPLVVQTTLNGAAQPGVALVWQVVSGTATLSGVQTVSDASGLAQAFVDVGPFEGPITVVVSRVDAPTIQQVFTVNAVELRALAIVSGDGQSGAQGQPLPQPLVVQATDTGAADAGVTILWSASGGATLSANSTVTDAGGLASVTVTSMGFGLDPVVVTAQRADNPLLSVQFTFNVVPATLSVVGGDGQSGLAGTRAPNPIQVQLLDGVGAPMAGQTITWQAAGPVTLDSTVSVTDAAGMASVGYTFGSFSGPATITASAFGGDVTAVATATSQPPSPLTATGDGQAGNPGDPLTISVQITDPAPDLSNIPITFTVVSGSATVAPATVLTDATGTASTTVTLGTTPGPVVIQASAPGGTTYTFNLSVNGTLVVTGTSAVSGNGQDLVVGVPSAPMVVELLGNGAPLAGVTVTWTTTNGTLAAATTVTDAAGRTSNTVTIAGAGVTVVTASYPTVDEFVGSSVQFTHNAPLAALPNLPVNEASVAEALDAACAAIQTSPVPTPDEIDLVQQCQALNAASGTDPVAVNEALGEMLPDVAQTQADAGKAATSAQFDNLNGRIVQLRSGAPIAQVSFQGLSLAMSGGRVSLADLGAALLDLQSDDVPPPTDEAGSDFSRWGLFFSGNIGRGEFDPTDLTPQYDYDVDGLTAGIDYRWSDQLVIGGAVGYTRQDTDLDSGQGKVDTQGLSLSGYTTWYSPNEWYVDGVLTFGWNEYDHERAITYVLPGSVVNQTAVADSDGTDIGVTVTFGRDWSKQAWTYGVFGRMAYNRLQFDAFEEEVDSSLNGNGLALGIESRSVTGLSTTFGGKVSYAHSASWGVLMPQAQLEWLHDFRGDAEAFNGFFVDDPTQTPILVLGEDLDSDYFRMGLGMSMVLANGRSGFINYERLLGRSGISQEMLTLGFRMEF